MIIILWHQVDFGVMRGQDRSGCSGCFIQYVCVCVEACVHGEARPLN